MARTDSRRANRRGAGGDDLGYTSSRAMRLQYAWFDGSVHIRIADSDEKSLCGLPSLSWYDTPRRKWLCKKCLRILGGDK